MIFQDLGEFVQGKRIEGLRLKTGADAIISPKSFPLTDSMIKKHVDSGCVFYRVVNAGELPGIDYETLMFNLAKMQSFGCATWQSVLVIDDSHDRRQEYDHFISTIDAWVDHGGTSMSTFGNPISYYMAKREEVLKDENRTAVLVPKFAPRSEIQVIKDWTLTLATFPGVGWKGAQSIRSVINKLGLGDDLLTALWWLTDKDETEKSEGDMKEVRQNARKWLGLPDGFNIDINVKAKEIE